MQSSVGGAVEGLAAHPGSRKEGCDIREWDRARQSICHVVAEVLGTTPHDPTKKQPKILRVPGGTPVLAISLLEATLTVSSSFSPYTHTLYAAHYALRTDSHALLLYAAGAAPHNDKI